MTLAKRVVLDSWPMIEAWRRSPGLNSTMSSLFADQRPVMSAVNVGEVYRAILLWRGFNEARTVVQYLRERVELDIPNLARTLQAAHLQSQYYMALGDGFAVATAMHHEAELWTGDPELLFADSPWRARDLRPEAVGGRPLTTKERSGLVGRRPRSVERLADEPDVPVSDLMDFLGLSPN